VVLCGSKGTFAGIGALLRKEGMQLLSLEDSKMPILQTGGGGWGAVELAQSL